MRNSYSRPALCIDQKRFGRVIRKAMLDRQLSYRLVGARTGIDYSHICQISHGSMCSSAEIYLTLCKFFKISPWKFVDERRSALLNSPQPGSSASVRESKMKLARE